MVSAYIFTSITVHVLLHGNGLYHYIVLENIEFSLMNSQKLVESEHLHLLSCNPKITAWLQKMDVRVVHFSKFSIIFCHRRIILTKEIGTFYTGSCLQRVRLLRVTQLYWANFFLRKEHFKSTSMFEKFGHNDCHLQRAHFLWTKFLVVRGTQCICFYYIGWDFSPRAMPNFGRQILRHENEPVNSWISSPVQRNPFDIYPSLDCPTRPPTKW